MTTEPTAAPDPIRRDQLPRIPPPEFEFRTVLAARPDGQPGCFLLPGDLGPVVVRRRVTYGDWEPVRPDRWADAPTELATPAASPNGTGVGVGTCVCGRSPDPGIRPDGHCKCACAHATPAPGDGRDDTMRERYAEAIDAVFERWTDGLSGQRPQDALLEAVLAVRDREMERLRGELTAERQAQERYEEETVGRFNQQAIELARRAETAEAATAAARRDGAREAAAMLRRTPRDYPAVLTGARVIEDWLDGGADGTPR